VLNPRERGDAVAVTVLGATGSIGLNTLDVLSRYPDAYRVYALTAWRNVAQLVDLCEQQQPEYAVIADDSLLDDLAEGLRARKLKTKPLAGAAALEEVAAATETDYVMAAIVGAAGLPAALAAAKAGKRVLLANKEALVMSGRLFMDAIATSGAELLPIDSEHNAVFQCLPPNSVAGQRPEGLRRIILTASGGPFLKLPAEQFADITPAQAVAHPNWSMGRKISVDSATLMNKGLEVIEAHWLFDLPASEIDVIVHPQSTIHSLVEYADGSILAELGAADMRTPIAHALAWPQRLGSGGDRLDLQAMSSLNFLPPDTERFPCLRLAQEVLESGANAPLVLNAANEIAVAAFLDGQLDFIGIPRVVEQTLNAVEPNAAPGSLQDVLAADQAARATALQFIR